MLRDKFESEQKVRVGQNEKWYLEGGWRTDADGGCDTALACETLSYMLMAYETYPTFFADLWCPDGALKEDSKTAGGDAFFKVLRYETDWLLSMQDEKTGGIYSGIRMLSGASESALKEIGESQYVLQEISEEATACFAAVMAKYGYLYQQFDWEYANICLKAAAKAWKALERSREQAESGMAGRFYAAAELYRASNEWKYHNYILQNREKIINQEESFSLLMGEITYLSTRRRVDNSLCSVMMAQLMEEAEKISEESKNGLFLVGNEDLEKMLWNMTIISVADYAITNDEYSTVIEEHVHYLLGRNRQAEMLAENLGLKDTARMMLMLSVVDEFRAVKEKKAAES